ncbi:hypothetical protein HanIR_Chr03g0121951 [Helianthus annuus]|nr:hypothetical protein HanIR_Chr03g0121951 [Helianthus annuus]
MFPHCDRLSELIVLTITGLKLTQSLDPIRAKEEEDAVELERRLIIIFVSGTTATELAKPLKIAISEEIYDRSW